MSSLLKFYLFTYDNLIWEKELIKPIMLNYKQLETDSQGLSLKPRPKKKKKIPIVEF